MRTSLYGRPGAAAALIVLAAACLIPARALALCMDPTACYCSFQHDSAEVFYARVEARTADSLDLLVLREPILDGPLGLHQDDLVEDAFCDSRYNGLCDELAIGDVLLVQVAQDGLDGGQLNILRLIREEDGLLPCSTAADYDGASIEQMEQVLTADRCQEAVRDLEGFPDYECNDTQGCSTVPGRAGLSSWLLALCMALLCATTLRRGGPR